MTNDLAVADVLAPMKTSILLFTMLATLGGCGSSSTTTDAGADAASIAMNPEAGAADTATNAGDTAIATADAGDDAPPVGPALDAAGMPDADVGAMATPYTPLLMAAAAGMPSAEVQKITMTFQMNVPPAVNAEYAQIQWNSPTAPLMHQAAILQAAKAVLPYVMMADKGGADGGIAMPLTLAAPIDCGQLQQQFVEILKMEQRRLIGGAFLTAAGAIVNPYVGAVFAAQIAYRLYQRNAAFLDQTLCCQLKRGQGC